MRQKITFCVLAIALLAGCAKATQPVATAPLATKTLSPTHTATVEAINTSTPTLTPTPIVTATQTGRINKNCLFVGDQEAALQDVASGTIIYSPISDGYARAQDLQTGQKYKLPAEKSASPYSYWNFTVSPDGNKLAYLETTYGQGGSGITKTVLWVVNAHGDVLRKITFNYGIWYPRWLDNEWLIFYIWETDKNGQVLMVNPFKHEQHYVWNNLPRFFAGYTTWGMTWLVEYSPNLEWTVYYGSGETNSGRGAIVRDITHNKNIWESEDYGDIAWAPDGDEVAITTYYPTANSFGIEGNIFILNREGVVKQIFDQKLLINAPTNPSWSPDGRYIAFWNDHTTSLYNKQTGQVFDYCIDDRWDLHQTPVWSPDSSQFVIQGNLNQGTASSVLIDIQKNVAYKITDYPYAWMNSLP
jgi:Tol biopolymer transport system component